VLILPMLLGAFRPQGPPRLFLWGREPKVASISLCPAPTSTFSAAIQARFTLAFTSDLYLRVLQHKEGTWEGFSKTYGCKRLLYFERYENIRTAIAREKQLKGWRRAKKLNLIGTINPEFKDLAQTWGWKMITVHERMYP
jgi:putative endonuclease